MKKRLLYIPIFLVVLAGVADAGELAVISREDLRVLFPPSLTVMAKEVTNLFPKIKADLQNRLKWSLRPTASVLLVEEKNRFQRVAESPLTVAFAVPAKNLMVIDCSRIHIHPFSLENILKHELCHLLLHDRIDEEILPRWLDEGVSQWVSDGIGDVIMDQKRSLLNRAVLRGGLIPLRRLDRGFPSDENSFLLSYEESKSFVAYVVARFGLEGILGVLEEMEQGKEVETATLEALSVPLSRLEQDWQNSLRKKITWFRYLTYYLYDILFALMALISLAAFIKIILKKRAYRSRDDEELEED